MNKPSLDARSLDTLGGSATIPGLSARAAWSLHLDTGAPSSESDTTSYRISRRPLARVGGFLFV